MNWDAQSIKKFRQSLGLTQAQFAEMLGITRRYVVYLESGKYKPSRLLERLLDCIKKQGGEKVND